jgi:hypothetical protein
MSAGRDRDMLLTAQMQARLCQAAYRGRDAVKMLAGEVGANFRWYRAAYVNAAVLGFGDHCHIAICGSNDAHDWVQNLSATINDRDGHGMHAGFRMSAEIIYSHMVNLGVMELAAGKRLYLGGHSCGGAIAQALSSPVIAERFQPCEVYAFGSPRVFSPKIAARQSAAAFHTYRFVMPGDPIPHVPLRQFRKLFAGAQYAHGGIEFRLYDDGDYQTESIKAFACLALKFLASLGVYSLVTLTPWRVLSVLNKKHSIDRYLTAINKAIERAE